MLQPIETVRAEAIYKEIKTQGSSPLRIFADDGESYIAKTTTGQVPWVEVINEILCGYLAMCWKLAVPPFALVRISPKLAETFQKEKGSLSQRHYGSCLFDDRVFFGSREIACQTEAEQYLTGATHYAQFPYFHQPLDWLKIGVFDLWVGNKDRKPDNPNILLGSRYDERIALAPIDHTAAFAYLRNHREVTDNKLFIEPKNCILSHQFVKSIVKFAPRDSIQAVRADVLTGMECALDQFDFIVEQVPSAWGFSAKAKAHLKQFLADRVRNERIASAYLNYLNT